ncbi:unnamed protein product [Meloidogyne enterolobii]|uniref:Uncharacterized protein n=1 Tax=Meloidogyne enterolobii TaxID=390850 RepID=A0ACB0ZJZ6_MELEN
MYCASHLFAINALHSSIIPFNVSECPAVLLLSTLFMATCRTAVASLGKPELKIRFFG